MNKVKDGASLAISQMLHWLLVASLKAASTLDHFCSEFKSMAYTNTPGKPLRGCLLMIQTKPLLFAHCMISKMV